MSGYLQKLVERTGVDAAPSMAVEPALPRAVEAGAASDPFEGVAEPLPEMAPAPMRQASPATERIEAVRPEPPTVADLQAQARRIGDFEEVALTENVPFVEVPAPLAGPRWLRDEPEIRPAEQFAASPSKPLVAARSEDLPMEHLEPPPEQTPPLIADAMESMRLLPLGRVRRVDDYEPPEAEPAPARRREPAPREFDDSEMGPAAETPLRLEPRPPGEDKESAPQPAPDEPRLIIGHLQVDVRPSQPAIRETVRVIAAAGSRAAGSGGVTSKLRFGLGQM